MKQTVIEKLRAELYDTRWCTNDFETYDVPYLNKSNEPFFFMVRENGTSLIPIGAKGISQWSESENMRIALFRYNYNPIASILYYANYNKIKLFYWNGMNLVRFENMNQLKETYHNIIDGYIQHLEILYPEEKQVCHKPLDIEFDTPECKEAWNKSIQYAESLGDDSLKKCVERLGKWTRYAIDQKIVISRDYRQHDYNFAEMVNGACRVNGGIIGNLDLPEQRWSTHT